MLIIMVNQRVVAAFFVIFCLVVHRQAVSCNPDTNRAYEKHYPEINYQTLKQAIDANQVIVIDSNSTERFQKEHIPSARSIKKPEQLEAHLPILKNYPIVVYCGGPQCTAWHSAADFVAARGYRNIMHFKGGIKGWKAAGGTLAEGQN